MSGIEPEGARLPATEAVQDYAKAIFALEHRDGRPVGTSALAERLGVAPPSASAMVKRLAEMKLVRREPYRGVLLTPTGEKIALEVIRHHRLVESYLAEALGMSWDRVHDEAEVLEHYISEELEELIASRLGDPATDPHGDPIPDRHLAMPEEDTVALFDLEPGDGGTFVRVSDSDPEMLRYLAEREIKPGAGVEVEDKQPFGGAFVVRVAGARHSLGGELVRAMRVSPG